MKRVFPVVIIIGALAFAILLGIYWRRPTSKSSVLPATSTSLSNERSGPVKPGANPPHALGVQDAPVMLEEFGDFQCRACALFHSVFKEMKSEFGGDLVIVFRQFPLESHANANAAARAAEAAGLQGKYWEMHDLLYGNQTQWDESSDAEAIFGEYAGRIGIDLTQFRRDVAGSIVDQRIRLDKERGRWIGVNSTPTVFLNGREISPESLVAGTLREIIKREIRKVGRR